VARSLLRDRTAHEADRVGYAELFFDLVFVFAVTQLSHVLLHDLTLAGVGHALMLFMGVWWVWVFTIWCTNWLDPETSRVRILLFVLMAAGLVLSMAIPRAFADRGLAFATAFVAMQVGRSLFMVYALAGHSRTNQVNFLRIAIWLAASGVFWLLGGLAEGSARTGLWIAALTIEYLGPASFFRVPGLGRSTLEDWDVSGHHIAERCGLFVIIALGESVLITGATFAEMAWTAVPLAAFAVSLVGSIAMWWLYFNIGAERASARASQAEHAGGIARLAYTYIHLPIVAGIIVSAAADELVIAHPGGPLALPVALTITGGPALYLAGLLLFKRATGGMWHLSHLIGLGLMALAAATTGFQAPLSLAATVAAILMIVAVQETFSLRSK
jgi:low temperature requirement protein LtrA